MKFLTSAFMVLTLLVCGSRVYAAGSITSVILDENQPASRTIDLDTSEISRFSLQVNYSTAALARVNFTSVDVGPSANTIQKQAHGFSTGLQVLLSTPTGPAGLTASTTYYAIKVTDNLFKLALVSTDAVAGIAVDITSVGASTSTWSFTPIALVPGTAGFAWQASNDGASFSDIAVSTQSLVSIAGGSASRLFDFGEFAYRILRINYTGPTSGAIRLGIVINGKKTE